MGLLDKLKKAVGKTGVELSYTHIEDPLAFGDPMVKATVTVTATDEAVTVIGVSAQLIAKRESDEDGGLDDELVLGEVTEEEDPNYTTDRNGESVPVYPCVLQPGASEGFGIFCDDLDLPSSLGDWGASDAASAKEAGITFILKTEVDIKETNFMFDPTIEQEIQVR